MINDPDWTELWIRIANESRDIHTQLIPLVGDTVEELIITDYIVEEGILEAAGQAFIDEGRVIMGAGKSYPFTLLHEVNHFYDLANFKFGTSLGYSRARFISPQDLANYQTAYAHAIEAALDTIESCFDTGDYTDMYYLYSYASDDIDPNIPAILLELLDIQAETGIDIDPVPDFEAVLRDKANNQGEIPLSTDVEIQKALSFIIKHHRNNDLELPQSLIGESSRTRRADLAQVIRLGVTALGHYFVNPAFSGLARTQHLKDLENTGSLHPVLQKMKKLDETRLRMYMGENSPLRDKPLEEIYRYYFLKFNGYVAKERFGFGNINDLFPPVRGDEAEANFERLVQLVSTAEPENVEPQLVVERLVLARLADNLDYTYPYFKDNPEVDWNNVDLISLLNPYFTKVSRESVEAFAHDYPKQWEIIEEVGLAEKLGSN